MAEMAGRRKAANLSSRGVAILLAETITTLNANLETDILRSAGMSVRTLEMLMSQALDR